MWFVFWHNQNRDNINTEGSPKNIYFAPNDVFSGHLFDAISHGYSRPIGLPWWKFWIVFNRLCMYEHWHSTMSHSGYQTTNGLLQGMDYNHLTVFTLDNVDFMHKFSMEISSLASMAPLYRLFMHCSVTTISLSLLTHINQTLLLCQ